MREEQKLKAFKGIWWMPWRQEAMKDVVGNEILWGAAKQAMIRRCPNGETRLELSSHPLTEFIGLRKRTQGSETSQYLKERKSTEIPKVAASEMGTAQTVWFRPCGVVGPS